MRISVRYWFLGAVVPFVAVAAALAVAGWLFRSSLAESLDRALLSELVAHRGEVLSRTRLLEAVWGSDFGGNANVVDVYVGYLRAKMERLGPEGVRIEAVRGVGYRLVVP